VSSRSNGSPVVGGVDSGVGADVAGWGDALCAGPAERALLTNAIEKGGGVELRVVADLLWELGRLADKRPEVVGHTARKISRYLLEQSTKPRAA
jgi:hypothetical protein